jgi:hypothetical protein
VHQVSPGEVVDSLANCEDAVMLGKLIKKADERLAELDDIPF